MIILRGKDEGRVVLKVTVRSNGLTKRGDIVIYGTIPMTREVADILEKQKEQEMLAKVHVSSKISDTLALPAEHDYIQTAVNPTEVIEGGADVPEIYSENISIQ